MLSRSKDVRHNDSQATADNHTFDTVKEFIYLGSAVTTKNYVSLNIKRRITLATSCYYGQLSNRDVYRTTKLILYKTLMLPYGAEARTLLSTDASALRVYERNILYKIFCPIWVGCDFSIWFNSKLYKLLYDIDVVQRIIIRWLLWLGYIVQMEEFASARRVFDVRIC